MRLRAFTRLVSAAGLVLLAAASTPAFGQTADVAVTLTAGAAGSTASLGSAKTFKLSVTNNGPSHATSFKVDGTFTPPAAPYGTVKVGSIAGCTKFPVCSGGTNNGESCTILADCPDPSSADAVCDTSASPPLPCTVTLAAPLVSGATTSVNIPVTVKVPAAPLPTAPADCPSGNPAVGPFFLNAVVSVPEVFQGTTSVDPNLGDNTSAPLKIAVTPWTDLAISDFTFPANASEGESIQYSTTLTNYGPCNATSVFSDFIYPSTIGITSTTGCANDVAADFGCEPGDIAAGASATYTVTATVQTFPKSVIKATLPVTVDIDASSLDQDLINGPNPLDPAHTASRDAKPPTTVDLSKNDSGCSTGGAGTLLGLLSLLALRFARRRAS
jgi:uncharacterized repeat protein (TIGR01451 family)